MSLYICCQSSKQRYGHALQIDQCKTVWHTTVSAQTWCLPQYDSILHDRNLTILQLGIIHLRTWTLDLKDIMNPTGLQGIMHCPPDRATGNPELWTWQGYRESWTLDLTGLQGILNPGPDRATGNPELWTWQGYRESWTLDLTGLQGILNPGPDRATGNPELWT